MKLLLQVLFFFVCISSVSANNNPETNTPFPSIELKTLDGKIVNSRDYLQDGKITIVAFWATWCTPCKRELDAINEYYEEWREKYNVQVLAITIDDARGITKVPSLVQSKGWEYVVLSDIKQELQQALNFQTVPQSYLLNDKGEIVYSHIGYQPGDEVELEEKIMEIAKP